LHAWRKYLRVHPTEETNLETEMYTIVKTTVGNSGKQYKSYLAGGKYPEFRKPGDSVTGVGISSLRTWKTESGAAKVLSQLYPNRTDIAVESTTS
jgi:hypothetical protein